jgi:hypothetical protein
MEVNRMTDGWVQGYLAAWRSNEPEEIKTLFTADAEYYTAPYRPPWSGHDGIIAGWNERRDAPGSWTFDYRVVLESPELGVVEATTHYIESGRVYSNLWLIEFAESGRCSKFTEYWMPYDR